MYTNILQVCFVQAHSGLHSSLLRAACFVPSLSVASLLPSLDNSQLPVFDLRCSLLAHYCGQLICQNFVLALSDASKKDMESSQFVQARLGTFHASLAARKKAVAGFLLRLVVLIYINLLNMEEELRVLLS